MNIVGDLISIGARLAIASSAGFAFYHLSIFILTDGEGIKHEVKLEKKLGLVFVGGMVLSLLMLVGAGLINILILVSLFE